MLLLAAMYRLVKVDARFKALARANEESDKAIERLRMQLFKDQLVVQNEMKREAGEPIFTADMRIGLAINADPRVPALLTKNRGSGVIRVEYEYDRTLEEIAKEYRMDIDKLLRELNRLS